MGVRHWKSGHDRVKSDHDLDREIDHDQDHLCHVQET
jgi:hypothetical protein